MTREGGWSCCLSHKQKYTADKILSLPTPTAKEVSKKLKKKPLTISATS